jgi:hypothetical protein
MVNLRANYLLQKLCSCYLIPVYDILLLVLDKNTFVTIEHLTSRELFMVIVLDMESPANSQTSFFWKG